MVTTKAEKQLSLFARVLWWVGIVLFFTLLSFPFFFPFPIVTVTFFLPLIALISCPAFFRDPEKINPLILGILSFVYSNAWLWVFLCNSNACSEGFAFLTLIGLDVAIIFCLVIITVLVRALNQIRGRVLGRIPKWGIVLLGIVLLFPYSFLIFYSNARVVMDKYVGYGNDLWYAEISSSASIHSFKLVEPQEVKYLMGAYTPFEWKMYCNLNETHYRADCNAIGALHFNDRSFCSYLNSPALMFVSSQASPLSRCVEGVAQKIQQGL